MFVCGWSEIMSKIPRFNMTIKKYNTIYSVNNVASIQVQLGYSIFYPYRGIDAQILKNQYALERMIVWLINPLEFNLRQFNPSEKNDTWKKIFESVTPKKGKYCKFTPWKNIPWERKPWKKSQSSDPLDFYIHTNVRIKTGIAH